MRKPGEQGGVNEHLMVDELVYLGRLRHVVEKQHPAVFVAVDDVDLLELRVGRQDVPLRPVRHDDVLCLFLVPMRVHFSTRECPEEVVVQ